MSVRTALAGAMLGVALLATVLVGGVGAVWIGRSVVREAQERVDRGLGVFRVYNDGRLRRLAQRIEARAEATPVDAPDLERRLERFRVDEGVQWLNVCTLDGVPLAGPPAAGRARVPVADDPVLRRAVASGSCAAGTVRLEAERLALEGGEDLRAALAVGRVGEAEATTTAALFWWVACPLRDADGRPVALMYGGRPLNHADAVVDEVREMLFGTGQYDGKPLGTVTVFLDGVRVATNVRDARGRRAEGTEVSAAVRRRVLDRGGTWSDRAWVVDAWYRSAYEPLRDPDGRVVGMLYVGLLEAPYEDLRSELVLGFLVPVGIAGLAAVLVALYVGRRIARPVQRLGEAARRIARGEREGGSRSGGGYREFERLEALFEEMREGIADRDRVLQERNRALGERNAQVERANRNYMQMLGFITHELKSPLAAVRGMIFVLDRDLDLDLPHKVRRSLGRMERACEELQDMLRDYLDLSRIERGEFVARIATIDVRGDVVDPAVMQSEVLFEAREMRLEVDAPASLPARGDAGLLRIALANYLGNAAKYGGSPGHARLEARRDGGEIVVTVWNEGGGFRPEEADELFGKFARLRNETTRGHRGSGLGLFICRQVVEEHGGRVWAESEVGVWARFGFAFPAGADPPAAGEPGSAS